MKRLVLGLVVTTATVSVLFAWPRSSTEQKAGTALETGAEQAIEPKIELAAWESAAPGRPALSALQVGLSPESPATLPTASARMAESRLPEAPAPVSVAGETVGETPAATPPQAETASQEQPAEPTKRPARSARIKTPIAAPFTPPASKQSVKRAAASPRSADRPKNARTNSGATAGAFRPPFAGGPGRFSFDGPVEAGGMWGGRRD